MTLCGIAIYAKTPATCSDGSRISSKEYLYISVCVCTSAQPAYVMVRACGRGTRVVNTAVITSGGAVINLLGRGTDVRSFVHPFIRPSVYAHQNVAFLITPGCISWCVNHVKLTN